MDFKVKIKPKIKYKKISADTLPKPSDWYCNICKKKYSKGGKYQHLKTDFHKHNEAKKGPLIPPDPPANPPPNPPVPKPRKSKKHGDYVENRLIRSIAAKRERDSYLNDTLMDNQISTSVNLPGPLRPNEYRSVPKPRTKPPAAPVPLPRLKIIRPIKPVPTSLQIEVKNLIDKIAPYYKPETITEFRRNLKFIPKDITITERSNALRGNVKSYEVPIINTYDPGVQLNSTKRAIFDLLMKLLTVKRGFKYNTTLRVRLSKSTEDGVIYREPYFNAGPFTVTNRLDIEESLHNGIERILELIAVWLSEGSGWVFESVKLHIINIVSYFPLRGSSYIELPKELRNPMKGLINPKNTDNKCFLWCHNRHLNPLKKDPQRITKADRESVKRLDYTGVSFPVTFSDMNRIEKKNKISVSVFGYELEDKKKGIGGFPYPIRLSKANFPDHMELLWIGTDDEKYEKSHYVLIKDFDRFMSSFTKHKARKYFCLRCLHCCHSERTYKIHREDCLLLNENQVIKMPDEGSTIYFKNHKKMLPAPFVIYADFEAITEKIDSCLPPDDKSYTSTYQSHKACGYGYKLVCRYDNKYSKPVEIYRGGDAIEKFILQMMREVKDCQRIVRKKFQKPLVMTDRNERDSKIVQYAIFVRKFLNLKMMIK